MTDLSLGGRSALVVGAGGPYARLVAVALAEAGARVSIATAAELAAQETEANSILNECWTLGRDGIVLRLDAAVPAAVEAALERVDREAGPLDLLVHAAPPGEDAAGALAAATSAFVCIVAGRRRMAGRPGASTVYLATTPLEESGASDEHAAALAFVRALAEQPVDGAVGADAAVRVCALVIEPGATPAAVRAALLDAVSSDSDSHAGPVTTVGAP